MLDAQAVARQRAEAAWARGDAASGDAAGGAAGDEASTPAPASAVAMDA